MKARQEIEGPEAGHGHEADHHHIQEHVKVYLYVFYALLVATVITVAVSYIDLGKSFNIALALFIASSKAFLVAGYFMHLISEKKTIYGLLIVTVFFFASLMYLTIWSMEPDNIVQIRNVS
jgi:cytochrome c oxidase subunit IV